METQTTLKLSIAIEDRGNPEGRNMSALRNPHPGEILKEEFLNEIVLSQNQLAHAIGVPPNRIHAIVNGTRNITADTGLRLCKFFALSEGYFLRLQNAFDTLEAKRLIMGQVGKIKPYKTARGGRQEVSA
jgi:antitoxin HigA-1